MRRQKGQGLKSLAEVWRQSLQGLFSDTFWDSSFATLFLPAENAKKNVYKEGFFYGRIYGTLSPEKTGGRGIL
jgi:hypothetical protein